MSKRSKTFVLAAAAWIVFAGGTVVWHFAAGLPTIWILLGILLAVIVSSATVLPYAINYLARNRPHTQERITVAKTWASPMEPGAALDKILGVFGGSGEFSSSGAGGSHAEVSVGSDEEFRKWGIFAETGRKQFPALLIVDATETSDGSQISARARDNLGWYAGPLSSKVRQVGQDALDRLVERSFEASRN